MAKSSSKELSKVPLIKKFIALDPKNPGTISKQRFTSGGKKTKFYYLWQSSFLGKKQSIRVPKESVGAIKQAIASAETKAKSEDSRTISTMKSYKKALENLMNRNKAIRAKSKDNAIRYDKEEKERKKEIKKLDRLIDKRIKDSKK